MSRKRTFALLAAFTALVALLSACGGGSSDGSGEDPQKVLSNATFEGIKSGEVDLTVDVKAEGDEPGEANIELSGPFQSTGAKSLPELDMQIKVDGEGEGEKINFEGGLIALGDRAYVGYKGKEYEVDPTTFGFIKAGFEEAEQEGEKESNGAEANACQKAATSLNLDDFADNLENEGGEEVDGVDTTKLSGDLDPKGAVDAIVELLESPACASALESAGPLPLGELKDKEGELTKAIKKAHAEVFVGEDDHIIRKVVAEFTIEPESGEKADVDVDFSLGKVNEKQAIAAPANAEPLEKLFGELGIDPTALLGLMQGLQSGGGSGGLGSLLEGVSGGSMGGSEEMGMPAGGESAAFEKCLSEANSAADVQKCAALME